jgi:DNA-binding NarL/FixJ family response regulator
MTANSSAFVSERHGPLILIIEDSRAMRTALARWVTVALDPCRLALAESAEAGVKIACVERPDVVLTDLHLPYMNGIEGTRLIKEASPETKVIIFTLSDTSTYRDEAFEAGACAYTLKHRAKQELLPLLRQLLGKHTTGTPHHALLPIAQSHNKETQT